MSVQSARLARMVRRSRLLARAARGVDFLIDRDWFVRNTLHVYARRPSEGAAAEAGQGVSEPVTLGTR